MDKHPNARDYIIEATDQLLADKLYTSITVTDIVKRAGVSRMSYYRYFKTRDELYKAVGLKTTEATEKDYLAILNAPNHEALVKAIEEHFNNQLVNQRRLTDTKTTNRSLLFYRYRNDYVTKINYGGYEKYQFATKIAIIQIVVKVWIDGNCRDDVKEISEYLATTLEKISN